MSKELAGDSRLHLSLTEAMEDLLNFNASGEESLRVLHMYLVAATLTRYQGNKCQAARRLGVHRNTIQRQIDQLQLEQLVRDLRRQATPQLNLFHANGRKVFGRGRFAQDVVVLRRRPQANSQANSQAFTQKTCAN